MEKATIRALINASTATRTKGTVILVLLVALGVRMESDENEKKN